MHWKQEEMKLTLQGRVLVGGILILASAHTDRNGHNDGAEHQEHSNDNQHEPSHVHAKHCAGGFICKYGFPLDMIL